LLIVLIATIASYFITEGVTRQITGAWKLVIPGAVELATIAAMLHWAKNRTGYMQVALLLVAWLAHVLCYADLVLGTNLVYDNYEAILWGVSLGQIAAFHDTGIHNLSALRRWVATLRARSHRAVPASSGGVGVLHSPGRPGV